MKDDMVRLALRVFCRMGAAFFLGTPIVGCICDHIDKIDSKGEMLATLFCFFVFAILWEIASSLEEPEENK